MKLSLEVIKGPETGRKFEFTQPDTFIVGRGGKDRPVHFKLSDDDPYVSRQHFLLEISPPRIYFTDYRSTNPPSINGIEVKEAELYDGDVIEVGYTQLKVEVVPESQSKSTQFHCDRCKKTIAIELMAGEAPPAICASCEEEIEENHRRISSKIAYTVACTCGKDLSAVANSDGRAHELSGAVTYCCDDCLKAMMSGSDAGKQIDCYTVIKSLGKGGMGKVYMVRHPETGRIMAMKQLLDLKSEEVMKRFARETKFMKAFSHPNVVRFIDSGTSDEGPYFIMELLSKGDIDTLMDSATGVMTPALAVSHSINALKGLEFIHANHIVHRDIKPANILLQENSKGILIPKIADFGIAKKYSDAGGSLMTKANVGMGTIMYMSPEQIKDTRSVREPADIYSMGVTLYYLLTGKYPYHFPTNREVEKFRNANKSKADNMKEALEMIMRLEDMKHPHVIILTQEQIPIQKRNPNISNKLARFVHKAIKKEITERYQTAREFRLALEQVE
ncbi:protein kinase (plasmid) [Chlorobium phaeovibrioides]|uniref:mitogen-activated protein kinase kinase n=1 Tax=Chlorobium phaeovibrioides TaxID=1094 RepID=A0A5M8I8J6_CHLPH|nr:FHA domain-containing serine/threonine-protein kinase [Chlorobium phaeovibrioides]KAA6230514.1 protein kinase [Chlorobium phaeovibrioides]